jgi:hypothetical protein
MDHDYPKCIQEAIDYQFIFLHYSAISRSGIPPFFLNVGAE